MYLQTDTECLKVSGLPQEELTEIQKEKHLTKNPKLIAYIFCLWQKKDYSVKDNGDVDLVQLRSLAKAHPLHAQIQKCLVNKSTPEETVFEMYKCLVENGLGEVL